MQILHHNEPILLETVKVVRNGAGVRQRTEPWWPGAAGCPGCGSESGKAPRGEHTAPSVPAPQHPDVQQSPKLHEMLLKIIWF